MLVVTREEPLRTQVRTGFADSIRVIWLVMIPFVRVPHVGSFLSSLCSLGRD